MRFPTIVTTAAALALIGFTQAPASAQPVDMPMLAIASAVQQTPPAQPQGGDIKVDVDLDDDGPTVWYTDPLWIVLGAAAVIVVVALVAMAARGGGGGSTTVIR